MIKPFDRHAGVAVPLLRRDIDTDQIVPKQFLKRIERTGYGDYLFYDWRFRTDGSVDGGFILNQPRYAGASILIAGANFGCGSSREHAAWALEDYGIRAVIAPSFADIFRGNAVGAGVLPAVVSEDVVIAMAARAAAVGGYTVAVDLGARTVSDGFGLDERFDIDEAARHRLLHGLDDISRILQHSAAIEEYERRALAR